MPHFAVKQPNGLYAAFSTVVEDFTAANQTREEAFEFWLNEFGRDIAGKKLASADEDAACETGNWKKDGDGLTRWRRALLWIPLNNGFAALRARLEGFELPEPERVRWYEETVTKFNGQRHG